MHFAKIQIKGSFSYPPQSTLLDENRLKGESSRHFPPVYSLLPNFLTRPSFKAPPTSFLGKSLGFLQLAGVVGGTDLPSLAMVLH